MRKRMFDVLVGGLLLLLVTPVIIMGAGVAAVSLRCWPFFVQERVGRHGRPFRFLKIRTLPSATPRYADKYALEKVPVPRLCRIMRRLHVDELPQLLLVLSGHMSLVGPRPEMARLHADLDANFASSRIEAKPGCTGMWQVGRSCDRLIHEAPEYDEFYLRHQNLRLDVFLLYRTVRVNLPGGTTLAIADVPTWARRHIPMTLHAVAGAPVTKPALEAVARGTEGPVADIPVHVHSSAGAA